MSIRVAIAGVGNCASSLVQGVEYYKDTKDEDKIPGLMHNNFGGYRVRDIEFVTAFDVDALKVGKDLSEAIGASQNNTIKFADVPNLGVEVLRGPTNDGLGEYYRQMITESDAEPVDVAQVLRDKKVDVLVSYLPVGSEKADKAYAQAKETVLAELRQTFRPEFLNRIDDIIVFRALTEQDIEEVARRSSSPPIRSGRRSSVTRVCRSSATTSSPRSAPRSPTVCSPVCSKTVACAWTAPTSSMWAATWTS